MYIGYIGSVNRYARVEKVLRERFGGNSIEVIQYICETVPDDRKNAIEAYQNSADKYDAILLSGEIPHYWLQQQEKNNTVPTVYIHKELSTLFAALLKAQMQKKDISNISIDTFNRFVVEEVCNEIGMSSTRNIRVVEVDYMMPDFFRSIVQQHVRNYRENNASCCITFLQNVYKNLCERNIPCILAEPSDEAIANAIRRMNSEYLLQEQSAPTFAAILVETVNKSDSLILDGNSYNANKNSLRAAEQVFRFAQLIQAAPAQEGRNRFFLITRKDTLEKETEFLAKNPLFQMIRGCSDCGVYMGIGFGETAIEARNLAEYSLKKALASAVDCTFICYGKEQIVGPVEYLSRERENALTDFSERAMSIASECSLSIQTIKKLFFITQGKGKDSFTAQELAQYYGVSKRTMYRILDKLMQCGYAQLAGQDATQLTGRPRKVYRIIL